MSYDLYLKPTRKDISLAQFRAYFAKREHYDLGKHQAWYENKNTGVYFSFSYSDKGENGAEHFPIVFNINYCRPSFFVLEAEPEVTALISSFELTVYDPQVDGMGTGAYDGEKLITVWLAGNKLGYQAIVQAQSQVYSLPSSQLKKVWSWNYHKDELEDLLREDIFVPKILLMKYQEKPVTTCVWIDAIPAVIPPVDILIFFRINLAPENLPKNAEGVGISSWSEFQPLLDRHKAKMIGEAYSLTYPSVPREIQQKVKELPFVNLEDFESLPTDQVLDREIVQEYIK
ncbi:MAG: hypothetical protein AAGG51_26385 [Cyanobacteria bacterium P01_G01_bin.54]